MGKVVFEVTSDRPCQIPVIGEFEAGETKVLDDATVELFKINYGYPVGSGRFASWVTLTATLVKDEEA
jgi:hypothetical protein